jgi:hypothetical protein
MPRKYTVGVEGKLYAPTDITILKVVTTITGQKGMWAVHRELSTSDLTVRLPATV